MNILITNIWLSNHAGTEVGVRDLAVALKKRGHQVEVYSPELGEVAEEIRHAGINTVDSTHKLILAPDLIHAQHYIPAMDVFLKFPGVPAIYFLHDRTHPADTPPKYSQIIKYLAVDYNCLDRLIIDHGIEEAHTSVLLNYVDKERFKMRGEIAEKPHKALVYSNYATNDNYCSIILEACSRMNISLDVIGKGTGNEVRDPESLLHNYDLVFAKAKAAMESLATGAGVILCDTRGLGEFVTPGNFDHFRKFNFGMRTLTRPVDAELIIKEVEKYNREEIQRASGMIRKEADFSVYVDKMLELYQMAVKEYSLRTEEVYSPADLETIREYLALRLPAVFGNNKATGYLKSSGTDFEDLFKKNKAEGRDQEKTIRLLEKQLSDMRNSFSFRLGRALTSPVRFLYNLYKKG